MPPLLALGAAITAVVAKAGHANDAAAAWAVWPVNVGDFLVDFEHPGTTAAFRWNVSSSGSGGGGAKANLSYDVGSYTGCKPKCLRWGPNYTCPGGAWDACPKLPSGRVEWQGPGSTLDLSLTFPTSGFYSIGWVLPSGHNASFGVIVQPSFASSHPGQRRDDVFSVVSFLTLAEQGPSWGPGSGGFPQPNGKMNYRPDFTVWRQQIIPLLGRMGVGSVREWGVASEGASFFANGTMVFQPAALEIRKELAAAGIDIVDLNLGLEPWMGVDGVAYPRNLSAYSWKYRVEAERYPVKRAYVEVYNEMDIHAGGGSGEQLMTVVQAAAYGLAQGGDNATKLVCGVITDSVHESFMQALVDNGLLALCDAVSFHSYDQSNLNVLGDDHSQLAIVGQLRAFLAASGRPGMPLFVTESGTQQHTWDSTRGYPCNSRVPANSSCPADPATGTHLTCINGGCTGIARPSTVADRIYGFEIVAKALSYKTFGVDRSFAFLLWYYNEAKGNYGLTGRDGTPVRALATLAQAINILSNAEYAGQLPWGQWQSAHVFRQVSGQLVAVIRVGRPGHQTTPQGEDPSPMHSRVGYRCPVERPQCGVWAWYYPTVRLQGIDGRPLAGNLSTCTAAHGCSFVDEDDGIIYAFLDKSAIHAIQRHTLVGQLVSQRRTQSDEAATAPQRTKTPPLPFALRYNLDLNKVEVLAGTQEQIPFHSVGSQWGYAVTAGNASAFNLSVSLYSLNSEPTAPATTAATLALSAGASTILPARSVSVPRMGNTTVSWVADLRPHADETGAVVLTVTTSPVTGGKGAAALPLVIRLIVGTWDCLSEGALNNPKLCPANATAKCAICGV